MKLLEDILDRCEHLAHEAELTGNTPVGAVVVQGLRIIGEGIERTRPTGDITNHAEVEAIRDAVRWLGHSDLSDCTLYTTHEPCLLCSHVIRHHGIAQVVYDQAVAHVGGATSAYTILTATDIAIWREPPVVTVGFAALTSNRQSMSD